MSVFLQLDNVTSQLTAATAATLNNVLTSLQSLSFFNKEISAQNNCTLLEYESYPTLIKYQLEIARNDLNAPLLEDFNIFAREVSALETYDVNINTKITNTKITYDGLYSNQFKGLTALKDDLVKRNQINVSALDAYQKSITSTLNTSNLALALRQSITSRLLTDLTPVNVPVAKTRLNTFINDNATTLTHLSTAMNGITAEIQSAKTSTVSAFNTLNTGYNTLSSSLKAENTAITSSINNYTKKAVSTAARLKFTGVGTGTIGVLGFRYTSGKLHNSSLTISSVSFVFRKGLATRDNLLCNGWLGGIYYVNGFSTTLPSTGTGRWNNKDYVNGIVLQGNLSTGYYNTIPNVSSVKMLSPTIVQRAKDNNKWYNYYPGTDFKSISEYEIQWWNVAYMIPHITGQMSDRYQYVYGSYLPNQSYSPDLSYIRMPYDNSEILASALSNTTIEQDINFGQYWSYLSVLDDYTRQFFNSVKDCQASLTSLLTAATGVTGASRNTILNNHFNTFQSNRQSLNYFFYAKWGSFFIDTTFPYFFHDNYSEQSWAESITANFNNTNVSLNPVNLTSMYEFITLLGNGHAGNYHTLSDTELTGIKGVSQTLAQVVSGDTLGNGSNRGLKPIIDKILDVHFPSIVASITNKFTTLCRAFSSITPVYAQDYIFLSGGSEYDMLASLYNDFVADWTPYLSSWSAFKVDANGDPQPFTGTYATITNEDNSTYEVNFEDGVYVYASSEGDMTEPERGVTTSLNTDYNLYTSKGFKIYSLIRKDTVFNDDAINTIKDAIDFLAFTLRHSKVEDVEMPTILYKPSIDDYIENPLTSTTNDGYVLLIDELNEDSPSLGAASFTHVREVTELIIENTDSKFLPQAGFFFLNNYYYDYLAVPDPLNRTLLYNVVLHELFHAFGVGTTWFLRNWNTQGNKLYRSYIIGVGDENEAAGEYGTIGNVFYNTYDNGTRLDTDFGTQPLPGRGDASFPTAYGVARSTLNDVGSAVKFYGEYFNSHITPTATNNLILTAIPVENRMGQGSYGCHWAEGFAQGIESWGTQGLDGRYVGVSTYPAPALFDELMTPISEASYSVTPITKISLGALYDVGWVVDTSLADEWLPTTHILSYSTVASTASADMYCTGGMMNMHSDDSDALVWCPLPFRAGVRYTIVNNPLEGLEGNYKLTVITAPTISNSYPYYGATVSLSSEWDEQWITSSDSIHYKGKGMLTFKAPLSTLAGETFAICAYDPAVGVPWDSQFLGFPGIVLISVANNIIA